MTHPKELTAPRNTHLEVSDRILTRVSSEFLEMPGLRLTCRQAQRLWGLDERTCTHLLESLVDAKFLRRLDRGVYMRLTEGHVEWPGRA